MGLEPRILSKRSPQVETEQCNFLNFFRHFLNILQLCLVQCGQILRNFATLCKIYKEKYENVVAIDECSVVVRQAGYKNYRKSSSDILRAVGISDQSSPYPGDFYVGMYYVKMFNLKFMFTVWSEISKRTANISAGTL